MKTENFKGKVVTTEKKDLKIHTYISGEESFFVTSHVIEAEHKLIVIDAQFMLLYANELNSVIKSLNKPVECLIITHAHPDHWVGLEVFENYPIISTSEVANKIEMIGDNLLAAVKQFHGEKVASKKIVPKSVLKEGGQKIAGLELEISQITDAEDDKQLVFKLPQQGIFIAQDVVYNKVHLFLGENNIENWKKLLLKFKEDNKYQTILAGHGEPATPKVYDEMIGYLDFAKNILEKNTGKEKFRATLLSKFSDYRSENLLDISNDYIFHGEHLIE